MKLRTEAFSIRLPAPHKAALEEHAEKRGVSMNRLLEQLIEAHCSTTELRKYLQAVDVLEAPPRKGR